MYGSMATRSRRAVRSLSRHIFCIVTLKDAFKKAGPILLEPEKFDPERFTPEFERELPRQAYMPFGAGPRVCIGNQFALMEGQLIAATLAQRVTFELASKNEVGLEPLMTLRPKGAMLMRVHKR